MSQEQFTSSARGRVCAVVAAFALVACGGGGGSDGGGDTATTSASVVPLRLTDTNASQVAAAAFKSAESVLLLGLMAANHVQKVARNGALTFDLACSDGINFGKLRYTLVDADGNGRPSAGDKVTVQYDNCPEALLNQDSMVGTLTIRLSSVTDAAQGAVAGSVDFGDGIRGAVNQALGETWLGSLNFSRTVSVLRDEISVNASAADDLRRKFTSVASLGVARGTDGYARPAMTRVLQRDTARASMTASMHVFSETLGGSFDLSMSPELGAYLESVPDSGRVNVTGANNARITLSANPAPGAITALLALDANGDGQAESTTPVKWSDIAQGFLSAQLNYPWSATLLGPRDAQYLYLLDKPGDRVTGVDLTAPLRLQFNRPVRPDTRFYARLVDSGDSLAQQYGLPDFALTPIDRYLGADVQVQGAVVLIQPRQPLRYGRTYGIQISADAGFQSSPGVIHAAVGEGNLQPFFQLTGFRSVDLLWLAVSGSGNRSLLLPGRSVTVGAAAPQATSLPLRYQWSQLDGPPLLLGTPDAASTAVQLAGSIASGISKATLGLNVTDAAGRSATTPVEIQIANTAILPNYLYIVSPTGQPSFGQTRILTPQTGTFTVFGDRGYPVVSYTANGSGASWTVELAAVGNSMPAVGVYANALGSSALGAHAPYLSVSGDGTCGTPPGSFVVREIAVDSAGQVQRLAVDFDQLCQSQSGLIPLRGSLRINSSVPIR